MVAEGVETAAEAAVLGALGVDYGQGWHFGRPAPVEVPHRPHVGRGHPADQRVAMSGTGAPEGSPASMCAR